MRARAQALALGCSEAPHLGAPRRSWTVGRVQHAQMGRADRTDRAPRASPQAVTALPDMEPLPLPYEVPSGEDDEYRSDEEEEEEEEAVIEGVKTSEHYEHAVADEEPDAVEVADLQLSVVPGLSRLRIPAPDGVGADRARVRLLQPAAHRAAALPVGRRARPRVQVLLDRCARARARISAQQVAAYRPCYCASMRCLTSAMAAFRMLCCFSSKKSSALFRSVSLTPLLRM